MRSSSRRRVEYDAAQNEIKQVHRPRDQIALEFSPSFSPQNESRKYRIEPEYRPIEYSAGGSKTPRARSSYYGSRYDQDYAGFYNNIKTNLSPNKYRVTEDFEKPSPKKSSLKKFTS